MSQKNLFKILFVEDVPSDVDLAVLELRKEKLKFEYFTVCTRIDLIKELNHFKPDMIISDYMMPSFNGLQALKETKAFNPDIPFILYTGSVNEEIAVECIKAGAQDYVIKEHMTRLPFAVKEALEQVRINKERRFSELLLKENEAKLQSIFSAAQVGIGLVVDRVLIEVNDFFCKMTGYYRSDIIGKSSEILYSSAEEYAIAGKEKYRQIAEKGTGTVESKFKCRDGKILNVIISSSPLDKNDHKKGITFTVLDITERKKSEEALKESQNLFQTLSQVSPVGIFRTKPDGYTTYVNPKWLELSGLPSDEAIGFGWLKAVHPEDRKLIEARWKSDVQSRTSSIAEYRFLRSDGSSVWVMGNAVPEWIDNEVVGYIGTITDITERKLTEEALAESETKYRQMVTQSPDGIFVIDLSGMFISVNRAICDKLKYTEEELLSMKIWSIIPENYHSFHRLRLRSIIEGNTPKVNAEYEVKGKDGKIHSIEVLSAPYYKGKKLVGFQGIARDITERKLAEKSLRESEERHRSIFENVQDLFYETSIDGTILEVSPSIRFLSKGQYQREELIGKSIFDFYSDPQERMAFISQITEHGAISDFEITLVNKDGTRIPCSLSSKIFFDPQGRPSKIIGSVRDITDRKNVSEALRLAKEKAEASDKLKTTFLNNISHEVRTPLNGILGFAEIISKISLSEDEKRESLAMLYESSDRLLNTITSYMDISLLTSGNFTVHKKDFNPGQVLKRIFENYNTICSNRNLELILDIPVKSENILINSDPEIFQKVLNHLLNNAVKFTEKGSIRLGFSILENEIEFFVKDSGIGIRKESMENIFNRFEKEDRGPSRLSEGSGLGLSISKGMVDMIGGKMHVDSEIGVGSCFSIRIPYQNKEGASVPLTQPVEHRKSTRKPSILLAEDDETNSYFLKALLAREMDANVLHASNGREAIELFKANPDIELVLMDMKMPEVNGFEATRQIKLIRNEVPVIAITAYAMSGDEERVMAAGCDGYLSKPITKRSLLQKMAEFIEIKPNFQRVI
jgi:PAS domain S-box-containing protein